MYCESEVLGWPSYSASAVHKNATICFTVGVLVTTGFDGRWFWCFSDLVLGAGFSSFVTGAAVSSIAVTYVFHRLASLTGGYMESGISLPHLLLLLCAAAGMQYFGVLASFLFPRALSVAMVSSPPEAYWVLFSVAPDVAETLAIVTLSEASLGHTSPHFKNDNGKSSVCDFGSVPESLIRDKV
jgi:hypothetical protein